jgi:hypothetical protein
MSAQVSQFKPQYFAGETVKVSVKIADADSVTVVYGNSSIKLTHDGDDLWVGKIPTKNLIGKVQYTIFANDDEGGTEAIAHGSFTVCCAGRSPLRDVIDKIDEAIRTWGTNPNRSIAVEGINITYKSLDELLAVRAQYVQRAEEQESGKVLTGGLRVMEVRF